MRLMQPRRWLTQRAHTKNARGNTFRGHCSFELLSDYLWVVVVVVVVSFVISATGFCTMIFEITMRSPSFT